MSGIEGLRQKLFDHLSDSDILCVTSCVVHPEFQFIQKRIHCYCYELQNIFFLNSFPSLHSMEICYQVCILHRKLLFASLKLIEKMGSRFSQISSNCFEKKLTKN
jgi:hypothetical protein